MEVHILTERTTDGHNVAEDYTHLNAELFLDSDADIELLPEEGLPFSTDTWDEQPDEDGAEVLVDASHGMIEAVWAAISDAAADQLEEQVRVLLQHHDGGLLMPVVVDTTYRLRSHPEIQALDAAEAVAGLGLWVWMVARDEFDYVGRPTRQQIVDSVVRHWIQYDRDAERTMESALRWVLTWAACLDDIPQELLQTLGYITDAKHRKAKRKTGLTTAEAFVTMVCYALRDEGGRCFLSARNLAARLETLGLPGTGRTSVRRALNLLIHCEVLAVVRTADESQRSATVYAIQLKPGIDCAHAPLSNVNVANARSALRQLSALSSSHIRSPSQSVNVHNTNGELNTCGGSISQERIVTSCGGTIRNEGVRSWRKEDVLNAASGREVEILKSLCGYQIDELKLHGQPCPKCPDHGRDRFSLLPDKKDPRRMVLHCRHCNWKGADVLQAVEDALDLTFPEACAMLGRYLNVQPQAPKTKLSRNSQKSLVAEFAEYHGLKPESFRTIECKEALREYKAPSGYALNNEVVRVTTYHTKNGRLFPASPVDYGVATDSLLKGLCQTGYTPGVYAPIGQQINQGDTVVITEGLKDSLRLQELHPNIKWLGLSGSHFFRNTGDWRTLLQGCNVIHIPDGDTAGIKGAKATQEDLSSTAASFRIEQITDSVRDKDGDGIREVARTQKGRSRIAAAIRCTNTPQPLKAHQLTLPSSQKVAEYYEIG